MAGRLGTVVDDQVRLERLPVDAIELADEPRARVRGGVGIGAGVDLRAVAGGQHDRLTGDVALAQRLDGDGQAPAGEVDGLPQFDRRRSVTHANGEQTHGGIWTCGHVETWTSTNVEP